MRYFLLTLLWLAGLASDAQPSPHTWQDIEVRVRERSQRKYDHILSFGAIPVVTSANSQQPRLPSTTVRLVNQSSRDLTLDLVHIGTNTRARWLVVPSLAREAVALLQQHRLVLPPNRAAELIVSFIGRDAKNQDLNVITLFSNGRPITNITIDYYFATQESEAVFHSGSVPSGVGGEWSDWYELATGPAPGGYTVAKVDYWLTGDRTCGNWAVCGLRQVDAQNVSFRFALQGHNEVYGSDRQRYSEGHLKVRYKLNPTIPVLR